RGRCARRGGCLASFPAHHVAPAPAGDRRHPPPRPDLHHQGLRHRVGDHEGGSGRQFADPRHVVLQALVRGRYGAEPQPWGHRGHAPVRRRARVRPDLRALRPQGGDGMTRTRLRTGATVVMAFVLCGLLLFPLYWMVNVSLTKPRDLARVPPHLFPVDPTFDGYRLALDKNLGSLSTSLLIGLGTVVLTLLIALPAAYGMSKLRAPGTGAVLFMFLLAQMIPSVVLVTALFALYKQLGLLTSYAGLMLADSTASVPFAIILLQAFMRTIPDEILESARIDGAGRIRTFLSIVLPLSRNAVVTAALFAFLFAWGDF